MRYGRGRVLGASRGTIPQSLRRPPTVMSGVIESDEKKS